MPSIGTPRRHTVATVADDDPVPVQQLEEVDLDDVVGGFPLMPPPDWLTG